LESGSFALTDSRLRPDQLALERGDIDEAEETKKRVEEKQRAKRTAGTTPPPQYFVAEGEGWKYAGQYCEFVFLLSRSVADDGYPQSTRGRRRRCPISIFFENDDDDDDDDDDYSALPTIIMIPT
jgi:hypothetical protein